MVQDVMEFKERMDVVVTQCFNSSEKFDQAEKDAFDAFVNTRINKPAELIGNNTTGNTNKKHQDSLLSSCYLTVFGRGMKHTCFVYFLCSHVSAKYMDTKLRSGNKEATEEELDVLMDKVIVLFRFIQGWFCRIVAFFTFLYSIFQVAYYIFFEQFLLKNSSQKYSGR